ncbi:MAG: FEA1-related lipoprotein [Actinomycetota bacterium]
MMTRKFFTLLVATFAALSLIASACSGDDGASVRELGDESESASSGSGSSGSASSGSSGSSGSASSGSASSGSASSGSASSGSASSGSASSGSSSASGSAAGSDEMTPGDGGYEYASNVDSHRLVVADICPMGDLLDAGDFDAVAALYQDGENSVKGDGSIRTIGGFAARDDRNHGLNDFYGTPAPLDDFVTAALEGTGIFEGESDAVRGQGVEKGIQNQVMIAWVVHELVTAVGKAQDGNFDIQTGAVHNWDEGWAFYHGAEPGCSPYATADKRAGNFGTTGSGDTSQANEQILQAMIDGRDALLPGTEDIDAAQAAADAVVRAVAITYSQATIRYAHLVENDLAEGDAEKARVHQAEGLAFWRVIEAYVTPAGADADAINAILGLENEPGANGGSNEVRAALQPAWDALGITADDIGALETEDLASGSASSSSGSGIDADDVAQDTDNPLILDAVDGYRSYVQEQIEDMLTETAVFADFIRDGDIDGAKGHYQISRRPWERIEPIAGLIEDVDGAVDSREDDFDGPLDPTFTGWHRLEYHLWILEDLDGADAFADQLLADLQVLADTAGDLDLPPGVLTVGAQELIEEVAAPDGKLSGEEERYSGTDLYAFKANVEGAEALVDLLTPALDEAGPDLLAEIEGLFDELNGQLAQFGSYDEGYVNYSEVTDDERGEFAATLGELAENLSQLNGVLGLG